MIREFKKFMMRGNVVDLAIGIIIGTAFNKIVTSLVNDVIMPPIGLLLDNVNFTNLFFNLGKGDYNSLAAAQEAGAPTINYGLFINQIIDFLIIGFVVFLIVKQINRFKKAEPEAAAPEPEPTKECRYCISKIPVQAVRCPHCTSELSEA